MTTQVDDILEHFGTKGMQWGVRKSRDGGPKLNKHGFTRADEKWVKPRSSFPGVAQAYDEAVGRSNKDIVKIKKKYQGQDVRTHGPVREKYRTEISNVVNKHLNDTTAHIISPSGMHRLNVRLNNNGTLMVYTMPVKQAKHAATDGQQLIMKLTYEEDENGFITKILIPKDWMAQSAIDEVDDILEHFGTKGMKWGVRKRSGYFKRTSPSGRTTQVKTKYYAKVFDKAENEINSHIHRLNNDPKYKDKVFAGEEHTPLGRQYHKDYGNIIETSVNKAHASLKGANRDTKLSVKMVMNDQGTVRYFITEGPLKHSTDAGVSFILQPRYNAKGFIIGFDIVNDPMNTSEFVTKNRLPDEATMPTNKPPMDVQVFLSHYGDVAMQSSTDEVDDILEHFGTKGMRWGVRKVAGAGARGVGRGVGAGARGVGRFAKKRVTNTITKRKEVHANRPHAKLFGPKKAKGRTVFRSGPRNLTDEELRFRIARLEMEKKYLDLNNRDLQKGKSAVGRVLSSSGETVGKTATTAVLTYAVKKAFETGGGKHGGEIAKDIFVKKKGK